MLHYLQDIWVANAAYAQRAKQPVAETSAEEMAAAVQTNLLGTLYSAKAAIGRMAEQVGVRHWLRC